MCCSLEALELVVQAGFHTQVNLGYMWPQNRAYRQYDGDEPEQTAEPTQHALSCKQNVFAPNPHVPLSLR